MESSEVTAVSRIPFTAALVSVGGSLAPILHVLKKHEPTHVWYFCSADSRTQADSIQAQLNWNPQARFIEVKQFEELGPCYRELRRRIPDILKEARIEPGSVLVDYTGGTKTMSAALVLAATELFDQFSYVGGWQREKGGMGVTLDGHERVHYQNNPWNELAIREVERALDLWSSYLFEAAADTLNAVADRVPQKLRFKQMANLASAMAARHRLDFHDSFNRLSRLIGSLPPLFDGQDDHGVISLVEATRSICEACKKDSATDTFLRELLDNSLRTAAQGRYEDAAARLYRAMEMQGQLWLAEATYGQFRNGKCKASNANQIPDQLKILPGCQPDNQGEIRLSLEDLFQALAALDHEKAKIITADIVSKKSRWRAATEKRNSSILAHGVLAIDQTGFEQMKQIAGDFLGFDLINEFNPIPPLDPRWLE